jgi:hypothetical protein
VGEAIEERDGDRIDESLTTATSIAEANGQGD